VFAKVTLTAKPSSLAVGASPRSIEIPYLVVEQYDLAIAGIDVTQGIQLPQSAKSALPARDPAKPKAPVSYPNALKLAFATTGFGTFKLTPLAGAAPLVQRRTTKVNVYAVVVTPGSSAFKGAGVLLHGRTMGGAPLPFSPLSSQNAPALGFGDPNSVPLASVEANKGAFSFTLPSAWTKHAWIELEAELLPPALFGKAECSLAPCLENNRFTLTNVTFTDTGYLEVWPLGFTTLAQGADPLWGPGKVFKATAKAFPLAPDELRIGEYRAYYDTTNITNQETLLATVKAFVSDLPIVCQSSFVFERPPSCPDLVAGVRAGGINGRSAGGANVYPPRPGITIVNQFRPYTSVGHETGHAFGLQHADTACGGNDDDQDSEPWWPDPWGLLYGITSDGEVNGSGNVGSVGVKTEASWYDLMSYCALDDDSWLSVVNYRRVFDGLRNLQKARSGAAATTRAVQQSRAILSVIGYVDGASVVITRARPKGGVPDVGPPNSVYRVVLRDALGRVVAEAPMRVERTPGHGTATLHVSADIVLAGASPGALPPTLYAV
jgi:hypothetical protein